MSVRRRTVLGAGVAAVPVSVLSPGVGVAQAAGDGDGGDGGPRVTDPGAYISFTAVGGAFPWSARPSW